jgi:hypothetical protein
MPESGAEPVANLRNRFADSATDLSDFHRCLRKHTFMSCWHLNDFESAAMWKLYVAQNEGIAIQTTFKRFVNSFQGNGNELFEVYVGKMKYLNYDREDFPPGNTFVRFLHKRLSFEYERELRAIIQPVFSGGDPLTQSEPFADALLVEVDLRILIERIFIAPTAQNWFAELVESLSKKYDLDAPIRHSELSSDPLY